MILFVILGLIIWALIHQSSKHYSEAWGIAAMFAIMLTGVYLLIVPIFSYFDYLDNRVFFDTTQEQYITSLKTYGDNKVLEISSYTDFVNQGFQENYADFLNDLRSNIVKYNRTTSINRLLNRNWLLKGFVVLPDNDMITIRLSEAINK